MTFEEWARYGAQRGWVGEPFCWVHGSPELTEEEQAIVDAEDGDLDAVCVFAVRIKED